MKKIILSSLFLFICLLCYSQEKLYKEIGKTQTLTSAEYEVLKRVKIKKLENSGMMMILEESLLDSTRLGESMVYTYKLERVFENGLRISTNSSIEKVYSFCGKQFPEFSLKSLEGEVVNLSDFKGKAILINFWFTGCGPCIKEMPALNNIKKKYGDQLVFLSISFNTKGELDNFFQSHNFDFMHLTDAKDFIDKIGINGYPKNILIDKKGFVHQILDGIHQQLDKEGNVIDGDGQEIIREIEKLLEVQ